MSIIVSKSKFKPKAFEYFRLVEDTHQEIVITDHGKPVLKLLPFENNDEKELMELKNTVIEYKNPLEPVDSEWEVLK